MPAVMKDAVLDDAMQRDVTTARRVALLEVLWNERYLTRSQLISRVGLRLGKNSFSASAWVDTFYRDMRFVKQAFEAAGYRLLYSRNKWQPGYYLDGQPALSSEIQQVLMGSAAEVDQRQIDIYQKLSFAERFHQGCSISDTARNKWEAQLIGYQSIPDEVLLDWQQVTLMVPVKQIIGQAGKRVSCESCGEEIINQREVIREGMMLCKSCDGDSYFRFIPSDYLTSGSISG